MRLLSLSIGVLLAILPMTVVAAVLPPIVCGNLPGCGSTSIITLGDTGIPILANLFVAIASAGALLGILWGAILFLYANGDDSRIEKGKKSIMYGLGGLALALSSNTIVTVLVTENIGQNLAGGNLPLMFNGLFASLVRIALAVFNGGLVLVILWAGFRLVMARGDSGEKDKAINMLKWAFIGAVLTAASRAIVAAVLTIWASLPVH